jgi:hypothetical protein
MDNSSSSSDTTGPTGDRSSSSEIIVDLGDINWESDIGGTLEVANVLSKEIVLFHGQTPSKSNMMGGIRSSTVKSIDVSKYVSDFNTGGYIILRGISLQEYIENENDLSAAKVEFNAFATYKAGQMYRVTVDYNYVGDYATKLTNRGSLGLELRKDGPEGDKVAYVPALQANQMLYKQTATSETLFPFYVFYNSSTQTTSTLTATGMHESVAITPRPASNPSGISTISFPNEGTDSWATIAGSLKSPVAYITVQNNVMAEQAVYFANAGGYNYYSQSGYNSIFSGGKLTFEVEAAETPGVQKRLSVLLYNGSIMVPVLFENALTAPVIENGYDYTVIITGSGQNASGYTATITKGQKRDLPF